VNLVFNFHSIWSIIAPESSFGRNKHILGGKICSRNLQPDFVQKSRTMSD
jgi:hypothetical protein